jgi:hypothetical protein
MKMVSVSVISGSPRGMMAAGPLQAKRHTAHHVQQCNRIECVMHAETWQPAALQDEYGAPVAAEREVP